MQKKWNNVLSAMTVATMLAASSVYAIPKGPCEPIPDTTCCEEPKPGPFAFAYPFDMDLNCPRDFYINADFLIMQAKQDGMDFALYDSNGTTTSLTRGEFVGFSDNSHDWDYNCGARVGIGFYLNHDAWNVDLTWSMLNIKEYQRGNASTSGGTMIPLYLLGDKTSTNFFGKRTSSAWDTSYNTIDLQLAKPYHVSRYLVMSPRFGLRAAFIDQDFDIDYGGDTSTSTSYRIIHHAENNFSGVGIRAGVDTTWILGKGWSLFGDVSSAALFGKFQVEQHLTTPPSNDDQNIGFDITDDHYMNVPNFDIAFGIEWGKHFNKNRYHFGLKVGYEFHVWWDQLNVRKFWNGKDNYPNDVVSRGNLTLNGFSISAQLDI